MTHYNRNAGRKGQVLVPFAFAAIVLCGMAGLASDTLIAAIVRARLTESVDAALLAAARAEEADMATVADYVFNANFPEGYMLAQSRSHDILAYDSGLRTLSMTGTATSPTFFMKLFGRNGVQVSAFAQVQRPTLAVEPPEFLILDEDAFDNSTPSLVNHCTASKVAECTNDDIADPGIRTHILTRPTTTSFLPASGLVLPSGQLGDEGLFRFDSEDPQESAQNGAKFTTQEFITATGAAANENNLDKITDVFALRAPDIEALVGKTVCAVVYDSDVSIDSSKHEASLKGATMGITAFVVTGTSGGGGSTLPSIQVNFLEKDSIQSTCDLAGAGAAGPISSTTTAYPILLR